MYELKIKQFEGPLDLLLHLIKKAKIDIKDIFIYEITQQYLDYIEANKDDMDGMSEFLTMAATLVFIKSKRMLPVLPGEEEDEDERILIQNLQEYEKYKEASMQLKMDIENSPYVYTRLKDDFSFLEQKFDLEDINLNALVNAFRQLVESNLVEKDLPKITKGVVMRKDKYTISEKMGIIKDILKSKKKLMFKELFQKGDRGDLVITFLSVLELISKGSIKISQSGNFKEIALEYIGE